MSLRRVAPCASLTVVLCVACTATDRAPSARPGSYLAVLNKADGSMSIIEPNSGHVRDLVQVGTGPHEAAAANDGHHVVVCNYGDRTPGHTLSVYDTVDRHLVATIDLSPHERPHGIAFLDRRTTVLVTSESSRAVLEVDVTARKVRRVLDTGAETSHMLAVSPDGKRVFTSNTRGNSVSAIDLESGALIDVVATGVGPEAIDVSPDGSEVWVGHNGDSTIAIFDARSLEKKGEIACGPVPIRLAFTPDGKTVVVSCAESGEVAILDARERREVARIALPRLSASDGRAPEESDATNPVPVGVLIDPRGRVAYVAMTAANQIAVVDLEKRALVGRFDTGNEPDGMAWIDMRQLWNASGERSGIFGSR